MRETQETISRWADATFGTADRNVRTAARANEEMSELLAMLSENDDHPDAGEEIADVVIVLMRLAQNLGVDLLQEVDAKMTVNRIRKWRRDGNGHGYHEP